MQNPFTMALIISLLAAPALAQAPAASKEASSSQPKIFLDRAAYEWHIRRLTDQLGKEPDNEECRLNLADKLETMAKFFEERRDYLKSWRYYEVAAHVLSYPKARGLKARAEQDARKAKANQQARVEYLSGLKLVGLVFVTFNWRKYKDLDPEAASVYTKQLSMPIRRNWSVASQMSNFSFDADQKPAMIVAFNIHKDGTISDVRLTKSCGQKKVDDIAVRVVKTTAKLPPLLAGMGEILPVEAQFLK